MEEEVHYNTAYRWFLGLDLEDKTIQKCADYGLLSGAIITDSTHIKASASVDKYEVIEVEQTPSEYILSLEKEVQKLQEQLDQKRKRKSNVKKKYHPQPQLKEVKKSTTDPDSGYMNRPNKPKGYHYLNHTSVDSKVGIITDVHVTPGNVRDDMLFIQRLKRQKEELGLLVSHVGANTGYDYTHVHKGLEDLKITGYIAPRKSRTKEVEGKSYL